MGLPYGGAGKRVSQGGVMELCDPRHGPRISFPIHLQFNIPPGGMMLPMKRASCVLALTLGATASATAQASVAGVWSTAAVPFAPWVITLAVTDSTVTGSVTQARYDAQSHFLAPFATMPIDSGHVTGKRLTFQCILGPTQGNRVVTFVGTVFGDSIAFDRKVTVLPGGVAGKSGAFGAEGPAHFAVRRGALIRVPRRQVTTSRRPLRSG